MKLFLKRTLIVFIIIFTLLPMLFANVAFAEEDEDVVYLTQERAGNYISTFAINFFNNWSSDNHVFNDDGKNPVKTEFNGSIIGLPTETQEPPYQFSKKSWINFVYSRALSLKQVNQYPTEHFSESDRFYEQQKVAVMERDIYKNDDNEEETKNNEDKTIVELMNTGHILPGDIIITSIINPKTKEERNDYLLYVGGTKVIYATDGVAHPTETGALKYDYIQNYFVEERRYVKKQLRRSKQRFNSNLCCQRSIQTI